MMGGKLSVEEEKKKSSMEKRNNEKAKKREKGKEAKTEHQKVPPLTHTKTSVDTAWKV